MLIISNKVTNYRNFIIEYIFKKKYKIYVYTLY